MASAKVITVGLVGTGGAARMLHGPAIKKIDGLELHSVYGRSLEKAKAVALELGCSEGSAFDDLDRMLADKALDALVIATPDGLHCEAVLKAAKAGKSVLVEKPMALSSSDCERMIAAFRESGGKLGIAYRMRFHLGHQEVIKRAHAGEFGTLRMVRVHASLLEQGDGSWRNNDPTTGKWWTLSKFGTHFLDQTIWAVNRPVADISAFSGVIRKRDSLNDAEACGSWAYKDGPMVQAFFSNLWGKGQSRMELRFDEIAIEINNSLGFDGGGTITIGNQELSYEARPEFEAQLRDFADAIREDREPLVGGDVGLENVRLLEMFNNSTEKVEQ